MEKSNEQLIQAFKKANKERKRKILDKAGFILGSAYLASLEKPVKAPVKKSKPSKAVSKELVDYVVAFDTTGSMSSYIQNVKKHVTTLIPQMFSQGIDLKMKVIAFGDYCDMKSDQIFGNAYQESKFTEDEDHLINFVKQAQSTGGGDEDEFYELVIKKITEETPWREGSKRAVLFIADCNPHKPGYYYGKSRMIDWKEEAKKAAKLGITFDTLSIHGSDYPWYKELAEITGGVYLPFSSQSKMSEVVTASLYVRGSEKSRGTFTASYAAAEKSGDSELIGVYKSLSTLL